MGLAPRFFSVRNGIERLMKDLYAILGVPKGATGAEIQAAYRELAKRLHPDVAPRGAELMRAVNEAYEVLKDPAKRRRYDLESKVKQFVPKPEAVQAVVSPDGRVNVMALASSVLPSQINSALAPVLEGYLNAQGLTPTGATLAEAFQAIGWLPKKRRRKSA